MANPMQPPDQAGKAPEADDAKKPEAAANGVTLPENGAPTPPRPKRSKSERIIFWSVAVVIMLLLAAIAIPNFVRAKTTACKNACIANLKQIDGAVQQWALENKKLATDSVVFEEMVKYLKGATLPTCPAGGVYGVSTVDQNPTCSIRDDGGQNHRLE